MDAMRLPTSYNDKLMLRHSANHQEFDENIHNKQLVRQVIKDLGLPGETFGIYSDQLIGEYSLYVTLKYLKELGVDVDQFYKINKYGFRSDEFTSKHEGRHVLFAGCSVTFGDSMFLENTWAYSLYSLLGQQEGLSGYYNIGMPSASISDVVSLVKTYIDLYGAPNYLFINLPDIGRDSGAGVGPLQDLMDSNPETQFFLTSWDKSLTTDNVSSDDPRINLPNLIQFSQDSLVEYAYKFEQENKGHMFALRALDDSHPGIAEHQFYASNFYRKWQECKGIN